MAANQQTIHKTEKLCFAQNENKCDYRVNKTNNSHWCIYDVENFMKNKCLKVWFVYTMPISLLRN